MNTASAGDLLAAGSLGEFSGLIFKPKVLLLISSLM